MVMGIQVRPTAHQTFGSTTGPRDRSQIERALASLGLSKARITDVLDKLDLNHFKPYQAGVMTERSELGQPPRRMVYLVALHKYPSRVSPKEGAKVFYGSPEGLQELKITHVARPNGISELIIGARGPEGELLLNFPKTSYMYGLSQDRTKLNHIPVDKSISF